MRLLLVEDEPALGSAVAGHLRAQSHAVDWTETRADAEAALETTRYDLVLLDLHLPDGAGLDLLRRLRARDDRTPVLIATSRDRITERIAGLDAGADDYLVKPYDLDEMLARIAAIRRRADGVPRPDRRFGGLRINSVGRRVFRDEEEIALTRKEWAVLETLSRWPERIVSREQLEDTLYGFGEELESNAIEAHVSRLRAKLGRGSIQTVRGLGYRMGA